MNRSGQRRSQRPVDSEVLRVALGMAIAATVAIALFFVLVARTYLWMLIPVLSTIWVVVGAGACSPRMRRNPEKLERLAFATVFVTVLLAALMAWMF